MERPGIRDCPLRVAVVGSGPAGFFTLQALSKARDVETQVDMFDRLPTPFGLVRHGVAPDHPKIKSVTAVYDKLARGAGFRFFGNVEYGRDLTLADLRRHYHQIVFCTGAQTDRRLGIPGEDLARSYPATEFVAWYNGHPDYADYEFDLSRPRAVVVGVGNVAIDVARILCRTPEELARTDIADHALEALAASRIEEVHLLGRRGPAQAAFTNPEIKELGELEGADALAHPDEVALDPLSREQLETSNDKNLPRKVELLEAIAGQPPSGKSRRLVLRFLVSPTEILDDGHGGVRAVRLARNALFRSDDGSLRPRPTGEEEILETDLLFRSVGYRGVALPDLPFRDDWGIVPNDLGRVTGPDGDPLPGLYVSGWIKRGPSGVIGTNKPDANETVGAMLEDLATSRVPRPDDPSSGAVPARLAERGVRFVSYDEWLRLDAMELDRGKALGRPRVKFCTTDALLGALGD